MQLKDLSYSAAGKKAAAPQAPAVETKVTDWFSGADDWGDDEDDDLIGEGDAGQMQEEEEDANKMEVAASKALDRLALEDDLNAPVPMQQTPSPDITLSEDLSVVTNPSSESSTTSTSGLGGDTNANLSSPDGAASAASAAPVPSPSFGAAAACYASVGTAEIEADDQDEGAIAVDVSADRELLMHGNTLIPELFFGARDNNAAAAAAAATATANQQQATATTTTTTTAVANPHFRPYFLAVDEEHLNTDKALPEHDRHLLLEYRAREEAEAAKSKGKVSSASGGGGDHDGYEKSLPKHGDVWFHKFASVVRQNPGQVLRYYRRDSGHSPLFLSKPHHALVASSEHQHHVHRSRGSATSSIRCDSCGGPAVCELQLLPSLINVLQPADPKVQHLFLCFIYLTFYLSFTHFRLICLSSLARP